MRALLQRFWAWRARAARKLNANPQFRQLTDFSAGVSAPVHVLAHATLRAFPFLRRLEWLLEIETLTRRHPVVLVLTLAFALFRGLKPTSLGHIATDKLIYPFIAAISGYNPFLGMLCGVAYGMGDLVQKFFLPDIFGARHFTDLNYWGAMVGYAVAYSSLMLMGLLPGMAARSCRAAVVAIVRIFVRRRARAWADGGVPVEPAVAPLLQIAAAAAGAYAAGWTVMHEIAPVTEQPAFYWRPRPDVSCHELEVQTHLKKPAPLGGTAAAAGAAAPVVIPPPPGAGFGAGPAPQQSSAPDEIEWTAPDGRRYVLVRNEQGQYVNILTGGVIEDVEAWKRNVSETIASHRQFADEQMAKLQARDTAFDRAMDEMVRQQAEQQKAAQNLAQIERNILFGAGPESHWVRGPGEPGDLLTHVRELRKQLGEGREFDRQKYEQVLRVYRNIKQGKIITESELPRAGELERDVISQTISSTAREFLTGQKADGSTSWLGIAGRSLTGVITGGASELVLAPAESLQVMRDYVNAGGDSVFEGFTKAAGQVLVGEATGRAIGAGISAAGRAAPVLGEAAAEAASAASQRLQSVAKTVMQKAGIPGQGLQKAAEAARRATSGKPHLHVASPAPGYKSVPLPHQAAIDAARKGSGAGMQFVKADVPVEKLAQGMTDKALRHARVVADRYGVVIDVRPTNPLSRPLIESGQALPKPAFVKNKSLTELDLLLGAKGPPGTIGHYIPKLPPKGSVPDDVYQRLQELARKRTKEYLEESIHIHKMQTQGKIVVRDGVIYDAKTGKPFAGDNDLFEIRDAITGRPLPRYLTDHKGNLIIDPATGQPKLNPVREQIVKELKTGPFQAQHGAHMDWKYDHLSSRAHDAKIDAGVLSRHQTPAPGGPPTEPLVSIGPEGKMDATYIVGGR